MRNSSISVAILIPACLLLVCLLSSTAKTSAAVPEGVVETQRRHSCTRQEIKETGCIEGTCIAVVVSTNRMLGCLCRSGYTGPRCEEQIMPEEVVETQRNCTRHETRITRCLGRGTCYAVTSFFNHRPVVTLGCRCLQGYAGRRCEMMIAKSPWPTSLFLDRALAFHAGNRFEVIGGRPYLTLSMVTHCIYNIWNILFKMVVVGLSWLMMKVISNN